MFSWISGWFGGSGSPADKGGMLGSFFEAAVNTQWRCLYQKCKTLIKPVGKGSFNLVVARVFEEGEKELEEENGGNKVPDDMEFPVSGSMKAQIIHQEGASYQIIWRDITEKGMIMYRVELSEDTKDSDFESFVVEFGSALFTALNGVGPSKDQATFSELIKLFEAKSSAQAAAPAPMEQEQPAASAPAPAPAPETPKKPSGLYPSLAASPDRPAAQAPIEQMPATAFHDMVDASQVDASVLPPRVSLPSLAGETVASAPCSLFSLNNHTQCFDLACPRCMAIITTTSQFEFYLYVLDVVASPVDLKDAPVIIGQKINNSMNPYFNMSDRSITWSYVLGANVWIWNTVFPDSPQDIAFKDVFAKCLYETTSRKPFGKVKEEDKVSIMNTLRDTVERDAAAMDPVEPDDETDTSKILEAMNSLSLKSKSAGGVIDDDEEEEEEEEDDEEEEEEEEEARQRDEEAEEEEDEERPTRKAFRLGSKNRLLNVSAKNHRALVCRGKKIGVFSAESTDSGLRFETCISGFADASGGAFAPRRMMLHKGEDELLMLHPNQNKKVLEMDLNRGDIVSEWGVDDFPINEILPQSKYAPQTQTQTMVGMNRRGFFMMDPRLSSKSKMVTDKSFFSLAGRVPGFSCAATTANGEVVMGTESGEVRLYDRKMLVQGKPGSMMEDRQPRAKTTFIGFGDPIRGIDVTHDGKWIVATCSTYLLLIKTDDAAGNSGFAKSIGKGKIAPRRLHLKPQHMRLLGGTVDFTPAKFDLGDDTEKSIVTSSGPFVITWDFRKAKQNKLDYYRIVRLSDGVVADQFRFGDSDTVVVAMPDDVTIARNVLPESSSKRA